MTTSPPPAFPHPPRPWDLPYTEATDPGTVRAATPMVERALRWVRAHVGVTVAAGVLAVGAVASALLPAVLSASAARSGQTLAEYCTAAPGSCVPPTTVAPTTTTGPLEEPSFRAPAGVGDAAAYEVFADTYNESSRPFRGAAIDGMTWAEMPAYCRGHAGVLEQYVVDLRSHDWGASAAPVGRLADLQEHHLGLLRDCATSDGSWAQLAPVNDALAEVERRVRDAVFEVRHRLGLASPDGTGAM